MGCEFLTFDDIMRQTKEEQEAQNRKDRPLFYEDKDLSDDEREVRDQADEKARVMAALDLDGAFGAEDDDKASKKEADDEKEQ